MVAAKHWLSREYSGRNCEVRIASRRDHTVNAAQLLLAFEVTGTAESSCSELSWSRAGVGSSDYSSEMSEASRNFRIPDSSSEPLIGYPHIHPRAVIPGARASGVLLYPGSTQVLPLAGLAQAAARC